MAKNKIYHYYVEGETEKKLVSILKSEYQYVQPGKVEKFNVLQEEFTKNRTMGLKKDTIVVLVFDTDTENRIILDRNINFLKSRNNINQVICVTQVSNLEDELKRSCNINEIRELTGSKSNSDFKNDMLKQTNFKKKLDDKNFDFKKFWNSSPDNIFSYITNKASQIKISC